MTTFQQSSASAVETDEPEPYYPPPWSLSSAELSATSPTHVSCHYHTVSAASTVSALTTLTQTQAATITTTTEEAYTTIRSIIEKKRLALSTCLGSVSLEPCLHDRAANREAIVSREVLDEEEEDGDDEDIDIVPIALTGSTVIVKAGMRACALVAGVVAAIV